LFSVLPRLVVPFSEGKKSRITFILPPKFMDFIKLFQKVFFLVTYPSISSKSIDSYRFDFLNKIFTSFDFKTYTKKLILKAIFHKKKKYKIQSVEDIY
jgi:hypothetical protein